MARSTNFVSRYPGGSPLTRYMRGQEAKLTRFAPLLPTDIRKRLWTKADPVDRPLLAEVFAHMPRQIALRILKEWENRVDRDGHKAGNPYLWMVKQELLPELFPESGLPFHATDDEIADTAERAARHVRMRLQLKRSDVETLAMFGRVARRYLVELPSCSELSGIRARMLDATWWRRALRKRFQAVEHAAIKAGCVHKHAAKYASDEAMRRHERHARRTAKLLESLEAVNENTGEVLPLKEAAAHSLANPENRRAAMMVCIRGLQDRAKDLGFVGVFVTITCPSRMHARLSSSGDTNPSYDGTSPARAQKYLARLWNSAARKLKHQGIEPGRHYFGLRVVEPHHDATPHWHLLAFVASNRLSTLLETLRDYSLRDSGQEPGAQERRFRVERIDPKKGDAAGYVAKYVAKSIDGHGVGEDLEAGGLAQSNAARIVACGRIWHWRQFQFFGCGALTPFRELYRLDRVPERLEAVLSELWQAARAGDFGAFLRAKGARRTRLTTLRPPEPSRRYPGELSHPLRGIVVQCDAGSIPLVTRDDGWSIRLRPERALPSLGLDSITPRDVVSTGFFSVSDNSKSAGESAARHRKSGACNRANARSPGVFRGEGVQQERLPPTGHRYPARGVANWEKAEANDSSGQKSRKNFRQVTR